jgi:SAM-dependent methyltransferase
MTLQGIEVVCPRCRGALEEADTEAAWACRGCGEAYPVVAGIPDLRVAPDPYIGFEADREKAKGLDRASPGRGFEELIDYYYAHTSVVPPQDAALYKRGLLAAESRARGALDNWQRHSLGAPARGAMLDLGCGTGPMLVAASGWFDRSVGIDIALRWLVVGKKRLEEAGVAAPLICACAEALPFPEGTLDVVAADSVIEHCRSPEDAAGEVARVLVPGGNWWLATPNRFSVGPDPHTGLIGGSMLPKGITAWYVRRKGGIPPKRRLFGLGTLKRLLNGAGFERTRVFVPGIPREQKRHFKGTMKLAISGYEAVRRTPVVRSVLYAFGPLLYAVAGRRESPS